MDSRRSLLSLPAEVRLQILENLLAVEKPIQPRRNIKWCAELPVTPYAFKSNPRWEDAPSVDQPTGQILKTCRQIYLEGVDLLYSRNAFTINVLIGQGLQAHESFEFLGCRTVQEAFTKYPHLRQLDKLVVNISIDRGFQGKDIGSWYARPINTAVAQIRAQCVSRLASLRIVLSYGDGSDLNHNLAKTLLHSFGLLRANHVVLTGIPPVFAAVLQELITSDKPIVDLKTAFAEAEEHTRQLGEWLSFGAFLRHRMLLLAAILDWDVARLERLTGAASVLKTAPDVPAFERLVNVIDVLEDKMNTDLAPVTTVAVS